MKYYVKIEKPINSLGRDFLQLEESQIETKVDLSGIVYVETSEINDIKSYNYKHPEDSDGINVDLAKNFTFLDGEELNKEEIILIRDGYIPMSEEGPIPDEKAVAERIISLMKDKGSDFATLNTYETFTYWDGSNHQEIWLNHFFHDSLWDDETETFKEMTEIGYKNCSTGNKTLYRLTNGKIALVEASYYQGVLDTLYEIDNPEVDTIEKAIKYIAEKEKDLPY